MSSVPVTHAAAGSAVPIQDCDVWESGHIVASNADELLAKTAIELMDDPYGFMLFAYPWGKGELSSFPEGPVGWQKEHALAWGEHLKANRFDGVHPVRPWRSNIGSGHGVGKSCEIGMSSDFIRSTRPNSKGVVTANTAKQLETKTWAEIIKWKKRSRFGHWFEHVNLKLYHPGNPENWRLDGLTCAEENSESFAGGHNIESTMYYLFDEASAIPDIIWQVAWGGMTDGEPMWLCRGNRTRNRGAFNRLFITDEGKDWYTRVVDSRDFPYTNKREIENFVEVHGEDSDEVRVRVRGLPPKSDEDSLISAAHVVAASKPATVYSVPPTMPIIMGVDTGQRSRAGTVVAFRRGRDARSIPWKVFGNLDETHNVQIAGQISEMNSRIRPDAIVIDMGDAGKAIYDMLVHMGLRNVIGVHYGAQLSMEEPYINERARIWSRMANWLEQGAMLPAAYGTTSELAARIEAELTAQTYSITATYRRQLTSKDVMRSRGLPSPDCGDALANTFFVDPGERTHGTPLHPGREQVLGKTDWNADDYSGDLPDWMRPRR